MKQAKYTLPNGFEIYHIRGKLYSLEYTEGWWEPSIAELSSKLEELYRTFIQTNLCELFHRKDVKIEAYAIVRGGGVALSMQLMAVFPRNTLEKFIEIYDRD